MAGLELGHLLASVPPGEAQTHEELVLSSLYLPLPKSQAVSLPTIYPENLTLLFTASYPTTPSTPASCIWGRSYSRDVGAISYKVGADFIERKMETHFGNRIDGICWWIGCRRKGKKKIKQDS